MDKLAKDISDLLHKCDEDNMQTIATHVLGYSVNTEDENADSILNECDFVLENLLTKKHILTLHAQIFEN